MSKLRTAAFIFALAAAAIAPIAAENTSREFAEMKLNKEYLSEESTTQDPKQALENADLMLINRINEYLANNHPDVKLSPAALAGIKHMTMMRGDHTRVLSYISIAEVLGKPAPAPAAAPAPKPEAPKQQAPAPTPAPAPAQTPTPAPSATYADLPAWQLEVIQELLKAKDITEATSLLSFFQQIKKIKSYGIVTDCPDRAAVYWLVGNPAGGIKAALSPATAGDSRVNYLDNSTTTLSAFSGNPAVWFAF